MMRGFARPGAARSAGAGPWGAQAAAALSLLLWEALKARVACRRPAQTLHSGLSKTRLQAPSKLSSRC